jgi:oxaloacetate decarboxylase alpha subunit/pyruvate carboxylase subunit B
LDQVKKQDELVKKAKAGLLIEPKEKVVPEKSEDTRTFNVFVDDEYFEVGVDEVGGSPLISFIQQGGQIPVQSMPAFQPLPAAPAPRAPATPPPAAKSAAPAPKAPETAPKAEGAPKPAAAADVEGTPLPAPMPGMIVSYEKKVGDTIEAGETVVVLEAMKMENALPAPVGGTIKAIHYSSGDSVGKNDVLCVIG